jgi:hypothetical protein
MDVTADAQDKLGISKFDSPLVAQGGRSADRVARSGSGRKAEVPNQRVERPLMTQSQHSEPREQRRRVYARIGRTPRTRGFSPRLHVLVHALLIDARKDGAFDS